MAMKSFFTKINSWKMNYRMMFIVIALFQCFTYIIFNSDFEIILNGDAKHYIGSLENLYQTGTYEYKGAYSGRMPGFLPLYSPLRLLFSQHTTLVIMIFIQLILYSYAVVFFVRKVRNVFNWNNITLLLVIVLLGFTNYVSIWGNVFYTESLAVSCFLLSIGFLSDFRESQNNVKLLLSGAFFSWVLILRPFMLVIYLLILIYLFINVKGFKIKALIVFVLPFAIFDSLWVIRNYINEDKIIVAQSSIYAGRKPSESFISYRKFVSCFGGDITEWNPESEGMWFQTDEFLIDNGFERPNDDVFPDYIYSDQFNLDSLKSLRSLYWKTKTEDKEAEILFVNNVDKFIANFKKDQPFHYFVSSKVRLIDKFIIHPYTYYLSFDTHYRYLQLSIKGCVFLINSILILLGYLACLLILVMQLKNYDSYKLLLIITPLFILILFPIFLSSVEYRFHCMGVPLLAIAIGIIFDKLLSRFLTRST